MLIPFEDLENHWTENQNLMVLLPILEYSYPSVLDKINTSQVLSREVLREVVEYSLSFPSRHWAMSAVTWMDNGFEINQSIYEKLVLISKNKTDSQPLRHKAIAQANKWKQRNGI